MTSDYQLQQLNIFYGPSWQTRDTNLDQYGPSGYALGEQINGVEHVIHINCGNNPFNGMVPNLRGQDPVNPAANYVDTLDHYAEVHKTSRFHVAFCLGGLNYGTQDYIQQEIATIDRLLYPRDAKIYWRFYTQPVVGDPNIVNFFYWTPDLINYFANMFNYEVVELISDANNSLFSYWWSNNRSSLYGTA